MADVKIIDIDNEQWNIKDQYARDKVATLETDVSENTENISNLQSKTTGIFHSIAEITLANGQEYDMVIPAGLSFILYSQYETSGLNGSMYQVGRFINATGNIYVNPIAVVSAITVTVINANYIRIKIEPGYGRTIFRLFQLS